MILATTAMTVSFSKTTGTRAFMTPVTLQYRNANRRSQAHCPAEDAV